MFSATGFNRADELPPLQGHTIGIVDTTLECEATIHALNNAGVSSSQIRVFWGPEGIRLLQRIMEGRLWGESVKEFLEDCVPELNDGHCFVYVCGCVRVMPRWALPNWRIWDPQDPVEYNSTKMLKPKRSDGRASR